MRSILIIFPGAICTLFPIIFYLTKHNNKVLVLLTSYFSFLTIFHFIKIKFPFSFKIPNSDIFCQICDAFKPQRSHHCKVCNKCTPFFDHHCHFMNQCIGTNLHHLIFFMFSADIMCILGIISTLLNLINFEWVVFIMLMPVLCFVILSLSAFLVYQVYTSSDGKNEVERLTNMKFNISIKRNFWFLTRGLLPLNTNSWQDASQIQD
ncbi:Palmitoyltransferase [Spironucleus salmonicida]|uniref:Palmitoyltransferase n=1 Tax=Spironucleus salmonicida TaxID=348837 RepID=V6LYP2_9EUKA|nr:Palmitoyltransferase [Spironucleus salmonicida]|eukprot:EST45944.1 Zinc finger and transmembrane domain-containing protein [Spironucleus salmonicida]